MHGVLLAAGAATRLNFKQMLVCPDGKPLILNSLQWLEKHCSTVTCVVQRDSVVATYLRKRNAALLYQSVGDVCTAIEVGCRGHGDNLIAFSDCWGYQFIAEPPPIGTATVITGSREALDGWNGERWVDRQDGAQLHFCGAIRCPNLLFDGSLVDRMNKADLRPFTVDNRIIDCGTPKGYETLWQSYT